ncbi:MAG TPA: hypothetical protein VG502_11080 [Flexivirga sp.]|uniref:hypothetical protein n=1 Tax=Flexivirga sp. TaxID=1962927 RepID=UPI002B6A0B93|nr:hypothetical protein [Flexivirga sp.]HWC22832.1 hypothetical protein [Flexivirga sp.]
MNNSLFTAQHTSDGVVERDFLIGDVPGVLWSPADASAGTPLVLMGHGGGLHKRSPGLVGQGWCVTADTRSPRGARCAASES